MFKEEMLPGLSLLKAEQKAEFLLMELDGRLNMNNKDWFHLLDSIRMDNLLVDDEKEDEHIISLTSCLMEALQSCEDLDIHASWEDLDWLLKAGHYFKTKRCNELETIISMKGV